MATFKDLLPSQQGWIHELARAELHPDAEKLLHLGRTFDPQQLIEESTVEFLTAAREHMTEYARVLNSYSENATKFQDVKIYTIAQTAADFMIFRNQIKLVMANSAHGVIQIYFAQHVRGTLSVDGQMPSSQIAGGSQDLLAQVGPFRDVFWTFQGEKITAEQVAKFYFAEFVRATRDSKRSRPNNQILLDQIKALLEEKGLEL